MNLEPEFRDLACRILEGKVDRSELQAQAGRPGWLEFIHREGLNPIAHFQLQRLGLTSLLPAGSAAKLRSDYLGQALIEDLRLGAMKPVLAQAASLGISCLVVKGTALAYSLYPEPALRIRGDTDLLIREGDRSRFEEVLRQFQYRPSTQLPGESGQYQQNYRRPLAPGVELVFDVHWKISNIEVVSDFLHIDELWERSVPAPGLEGRIPALVDSLLLACVHRVAHHNRSRAVLWLFDIHLLAGALDPEKCDTFEQRVLELGVREICRNSLDATREAFPSEAVHRLLERLQRTPAAAEASQALLEDHRPVDLLWMNFRQLTGWGARARWIREQLFPPWSYMHERYGKRGPAGTCILYLSRIGKGLGQFLRSRIRY